MTAFAHDGGFGAQHLGDGRTRFSLWAPAAARVEVLLDDGRSLLLAAAENGLHRGELAVGPGQRYRYRIDGGQAVPDPASRAQADGVHGDSVVVDPHAYRWQQPQWNGRPWHETVLYEVHVGCCGGFEALAARLPAFAERGITAIELMPIAAFPGQRNWGYDGVLPFAPARAYGSPDQLKALIDRAHALGLCVHLDVVYNHFGPDGNYLHLYAPQFFDAGQHSPWGAAIDFSQAQVRRFFIANALHWLLEYRFDGLRLDAVHAIGDSGWLDEMAAAARAAIEPGRQVHLVLENERNTAAHLERDFDAQWNDDGHNALHALLTGERDGYYRNYSPDPLGHLVRCLREGFAWQGEIPPTGSKPRGEPSAHLPPSSFVLFLQNHDQIGNRAFGERLRSLVDDDTLRAAVLLQLLSPQIPLLFMGEDSGERAPFLYFTDFHDELGEAVREGRRREFAAFPAFVDEAQRARIPDPNAEATFLKSIPGFDREDEDARGWRCLYRDLLQIRRERLLPGLASARCKAVRRCGPSALQASWLLDGSTTLTIAVNFDTEAARCSRVEGELLFESCAGAASGAREGRLQPRCAAAFLQPDDRVAASP